MKSELLTEVEMGTGKLYGLSSWLVVLPEIETLLTS